MNRWYATTEPQHMLPAGATCTFGSTRRVSDNHSIKPTPGEAPTSA